MTLEEVIRAFRKEHPATAEEALVNCFVPLSFVAEGCFRRAYQIGRLPVIVKFPYKQNDLESGILHTNLEMGILKRIRRSKRKFAGLHQHMPEVYYSNERTGVVLMRMYKQRKYSAPFAKACSALEEKIIAAFKYDSDTSLDCHTGNCGFDGKGNLIVYDLGLIDQTSDSDKEG